jgi:nucleotidyltransferase/DNA polymerase involved in DNA repair
MPGYIALKLCPQLKIMPLNFPKYRAASAKVRAIFEQYDPHFCPMSLDEVSVDHQQTTHRIYVKCIRLSGVLEHH